MNEEELRKELAKRQIPLPETAFSVYRRLTALLQDWNRRFNLTAIDEPEEVYEKHILDCLLPLQHVSLYGTVCDVGSGAGFPGLVWAAARPECAFTLIEPTAKRCSYLEECVRTCELANVEIINARAEDQALISRESFDIVTARAVANLTVLSELCVPLVRVGGLFLALKGAKGEEELGEAQFALKTLGCDKPELITMELPSGARTLILARKIHKTPSSYPRSYAKIKHKPLIGKGSHGAINL